MKFTGILFYVAALVVAALCFPLKAHAEKKGLLTISAGVNGVWPTGTDVAFPSAFEAGATASSSLSPHLSLVASSFYGFKDEYIRWRGGARVTASDIEDQNLSVFLGAGYRGADKQELFPSEWEVDAGFGWAPFRANRNIILGADAALGLKSNDVLSVVAVRYRFPVR